MLSDSYDVTYFKEPEEINYTVDRSMEYGEVLQAEDTVNVYGDTLLQTDEVDIISGLNNSVIAKVDDTNIKKINYSDYGATKDITSGNGYNGEILDQTGLIYLRARYYDPSVSRFVQIDNNYNGEKEHVASQNKYVYTLSNPYKYVDKDGNRVTKCPPAGGGVLLGATGILSYLFMSDKDFKKWIMKRPIWERPFYIMNRIAFQAKLKEGQAKPKPNNGGGQNNTTGNGGGSNQTKNEKPKVEPKCPEKDMTYKEALKIYKENDLGDKISKSIDIGLAIKDICLYIIKGVKVNGLSVLLGRITSLKFGAKSLSIKGSQKFVKDYLSMSTGGNRRLGNTLKTAAKGQSALFSKGNALGAFISAGVDVVTAIVDCLLGIITVIRVIATGLGQFLYALIKGAAVSTIRAVLTPFIGPFAWFLGLIIDWGIDKIGWFISIRKTMIDIAEWMIKQSFLYQLLTTIGKMFG